MNKSISDDNLEAGDLFCFLGTPGEEFNILIGRHGRFYRYVNGCTGSTCVYEHFTGWSLPSDIGKATLLQRRCKEE